MHNLNLIIGDDKQLIDFYLKDIISKINCDDKIYYDLSSLGISHILDEASIMGLISNIKIIIGTIIGFKISANGKSIGEDGQKGIRRIQF